MKKLLFFLFIFFALSMFSQNKELDKSFINLNYQAIILVQKHMVAKQLTNYHNDFKKLLVLQSESINLFSENITLSMDKANLVRQECLKFMQLYTPNSVGYFTKDFNSNKELIGNSRIENISLAEKQLAEIKSLDVTDLNCTKNISLRMQ
jgi:hypothetical protein